MTPKEKAYQLVLKFEFKQEGIRKELAKRSALIAVNEIKQQLIENLSNDISAIHAIYWEKVKEEIEKL